MSVYSLNNFFVYIVISLDVEYFKIGCLGLKLINNFFIISTVTFRNIDIVAIFGWLANEQTGQRAAFLDDHTETKKLPYHYLLKVKKISES